tara:strand:- start:247 stop:732 length:486 start_codon:yes stop_codon:yes gene_type:complete
MSDTDKYENMRQLFLDFIESASDEVDEEAWRDKLTMLDELLAEVKRLRKHKKVLDEEGRIDYDRLLILIRDRKRLQKRNKKLELRFHRVGFGYYREEWEGLLAEVERLGQENKELEGFLNDSDAASKSLCRQLIRAAEWASAKVYGDQEKVDAFWDYIEEE